jgi:CNT family concentrative nucleoside transporter
MTASVMSAPAALVIAKMIVPDAPGAERASLPYEARLHERAGSAFDAITTGARDGLFLALNVCAMLIAVVALIALLNAVLGVVSRWCHGPSLTLELLFGYVGWPFGLLMGVEPREAHSVGELLATKIFFTEFIAYKELAARASALTPRTVTIATYACCGFANFGSVAILIGGLSSLAPTRLQEVTQLALKALIGGALASFCTAAIAGMLL